MPPSPRGSYPRNLVSASGDQDHTTSPSASATLVRRSQHVHRIPPRVRDDASAPLHRDEMAQPTILLIYRISQTNYFCATGWTKPGARAAICPTGAAKLIVKRVDGNGVPSWRTTGQTIACHRNTSEIAAELRKTALRHAGSTRAASAGRRAKCEPDHGRTRLPRIDCASATMRLRTWSERCASADCR